MRSVTIFACLILAGCSGGGQIAQPANPLVHPPWEALVQAGPGAENDIDYETLDGPKIATAHPGEIKLDSDIEVAALSTDNTSATPTESTSDSATAAAGKEVIKAVAILPVQGAGSRGNIELTQAMSAILADAGWPVLPTKRKDAVNIQGKVDIGNAQNGSQAVSIVWVVSTPSGRKLGDVKQQNDVPAGTLSKGWGDSAVEASQAAAEGISKLILAYR